MHAHIYIGQKHIHGKILMIIQANGTVRFLTSREHLRQKTLVYQDKTCSIHLSSDKRQPFDIREGRADSEVYIDLFALQFGQKERVERRTGKSGWTPIHFCCDRATRDSILSLPVEVLIDTASQYQCRLGCQYYSPPTGVKGPYAFSSILFRYRVFGLFDMKSGLTLEEVGRIYGCTRERIRQIQENAMRKLRHVTRRERLKIFQERVSDYRDFFHSQTEEDFA
jgi:hypothetical protein